MPIPANLIELIERFDANLRFYKSGAYNETEVRQQFINPFFSALGWDMADNLGRRDVIHEDKVDTEAGLKAPDYSFRINHKRMFFVEAKRPSVNLLDSRDPAFQVRRYGWSAQLPVSILTDFEEFALYDCRLQPNPNDPPAHGRLDFFTFKQYDQKWDWLEATFSYQAVLNGSLDSYIASHKEPRGSITVDAAFLKEIEAWREMLARNLALHNPSLTQRDLNYAVQMTIDRLIFLRICEDREIEPYGRLRQLETSSRVYEQLRDIFRQADERYNSGLFHFTTEKGQSEGPDELTLKLTIGDEVLQKIIHNLYYPAPYAFKVIPVEILGQVYEQFLGKVIQLDAQHDATVVEKPEVRKAGGVYYTPTYIVEYIVKNTVGKLLEGKTPAQAEALRLLDPACGSGSFLLGAYQYLLNWYLAQYVAEPKKYQKQKRLEQDAHGEWRLTIAERKRILLNNIYGVDIDRQAVEVTKLSLLLRVLEGETSQNLFAQLQMFRERALPDLSNNIKCGNSLIGPDFYQQQQMNWLDDEEQYRINAFDWQAEFSTIMQAGGFDAVIGNPPYIRMETFKELKTYLKAVYTSHNERSDLYSYIIERAHKLLKVSGRFGMIVSNKFLRANYGKPLRDFLEQNAIVERIVDFAGLPVFVGATVRTIILLTLREQKDKYLIHYTPPLPIDLFNKVVIGAILVEQAISNITYEVDSASLSQLIWGFAKADTSDLLAQLKSRYKPLGQYCKGQVCMGIKSGLTEAFVINEETRESILSQNPEAQEIIKPFLNGRDVRRYQIEPKKAYILYTYHGVNIQKYPAIEQYLKSFKTRLVQRATKQNWYELQQPQYKFAQYMDKPKIIFPDIAITPRFTLDSTGYYSSNTTYFIARYDQYLLGLLNSALGYFYFRETCAGLEGKNETYLRFFGQYLEGFPIRTINFDDSADKARHDRMVELVERMLELHKRLGTAQTSPDKTMLTRQIEATDREIDRLVYELYDLTAEEIRLVEG
jgi:type I restriction-modification system DNA methylase subunit